MVPPLLIGGLALALPFAAGVIMATAAFIHRAEHHISASIGGRESAALQMVSDANRVIIRIGDLGGDLYEISNMVDATRRPVMEEKDGVLTLRMDSDPDRRADDDLFTEIRLSDRVTWNLRFDGRYNNIDADLTNGRLSGLHLAGFTILAQVRLPTPAAMVPVRITGGVSDIRVWAPDGVPTRVRTGAAAAAIVLDENYYGFGNTGDVYTTSGWDGASPGYDVDCSGTIGSLTLSRIA